MCEDYRTLLRLRILDHASARQHQSWWRLHSNQLVVKLTPHPSPIETFPLYNCIIKFSPTPDEKGLGYRHSTQALPKQTGNVAVYSIRVLVDTARDALSHSLRKYLVIDQATLHPMPTDLVMMRSGKAATWSDVGKRCRRFSYGKPAATF